MPAGCAITIVLLQLRAAEGMTNDQEGRQRGEEGVRGEGWGLGKPQVRPGRPPSTPLEFVGEKRRLPRGPDVEEDGRKGHRAKMDGAAVEARPSLSITKLD